MIYILLLALALLTGSADATFCKITDGLVSAPQRIEQKPIVLTFVDGYEIVSVPDIEKKIVSAIAEGLIVSPARVCVSDVVKNVDNRWQTSVFFYSNFMDDDINKSTFAELQRALLPANGSPSTAVNTYLGSQLDEPRCVYSSTDVILRLCLAESAFLEPTAICPSDNPNPTDDVDERGTALTLLLGIGSFVVTFIVVVVFSYSLNKYEREADIKQLKRIEQARRTRG